MLSKIRKAQEQSGIVYPLDIPECITLDFNDRQLRRIDRENKPNMI